MRNPDPQHETTPAMTEAGRGARWGEAGLFWLYFLVIVLLRLPILVYPIIIAIWAPKIAYRRRDWLFLLIPIYGFVFLVTTLWRFAHIRHPYWSEREVTP
jgi:hypothetical protein